MATKKRKKKLGMRRRNRAAAPSWSARGFLHGLCVVLACGFVGSITGGLVFRESTLSILSSNFPFATVLSAVTAVLFSIPIVMALFAVDFELFPIVMLLCFVPGALIDSIVFLGGFDIPVSVTSWTVVGGIYGGIVSPFVSKTYMSLYS